MFKSPTIKKYSSAAIALSLFLNTTGSCFALGLNKQADDFFETQTGAYLHAAYPLMTPKDSVKAAIDHVVTVHKSYIEDNFNNKGMVVFDYVNKSQEIDKLYKNIKIFLKKEITVKETHCVFYHGHSSPMSAYYDILKEFIEVAGIKALGKANPLHYKSPASNEIRDVKDFFQKDRYLKAHLQNVKDIKAAAFKNFKADPTNPDNIDNFKKAKNLTPFNAKKNLGVGKAPDSADYARDHLKCVNFSLFGNSENVGESSFLFFLTSGNIAKLDRYLTERLFKQLGLLSSTSTAREIDATLTKYETIFTSKLGQAGGGMMQILMDNKIVDQYGFAAWAKGIPYFIDQKTGKFVTRGHNNKAVAVLTNDNKKLALPSLKKMIDLYKKNPKGFSRKFSFDGKVNLMHLDRAQARLFINPKIFGNNNLIKINRIYRHEVDRNAQAAYKVDLHKQMVEDIKDAVSKNQMTKDFYRQNLSLGKMLKFVFTREMKISDIMGIISHSSKERFSEVFEIVKTAVAKIPNIGAKVVEKMKALETVEGIKTKFKNIGMYAKKLIFRVLKAFS